MLKTYIANVYTRQQQIDVYFLLKEYVYCDKITVAYTSMFKDDRILIVMLTY